MSAPREIKLESVRKLRPNKRNARTHPKKQISQITASIQRFGWTYSDHYRRERRDPRRARSLLGGTGAWTCREVPVIVIAGLSDAEKRALALADNKIAENAGWDRELLAEELSELADLLPDCNLDLEITGFEPAEIDGLLGDLVDPELDPADDVSPPQNTQSAKSAIYGSLALTGSCAATPSPRCDVRRLMGTESATMVMTDPPYNLPIKRVQGRGRIKHGDFAQASGEMSRGTSSLDFLRIALSLAAKHSVTAPSILFSSTGATLASSLRRDRQSIPNSRTSSCG